MTREELVEKLRRNGGVVSKLKADLEASRRTTENITGNLSRACEEHEVMIKLLKETDWAAHNAREQEGESLQLAVLLKELSKS